MQADAFVANDNRRDRYLKTLTDIAFKFPKEKRLSKAPRNHRFQRIYRALQIHFPRFLRSHFTAPQRLTYLQNPQQMLYLSSIVAFLGGAVAQYVNWTTLVQLRPNSVQDFIAPYYLHCLIGLPLLTILCTPVLVEWAGNVKLLLLATVRNVAAYFIGALIMLVGLAVPVYIGSTYAITFPGVAVDHNYLVTSSMIEPALIIAFFLPLVFTSALLLDLALKKRFLLSGTIRSFQWRSSAGSLLIVISMWSAIVFPGITVLTGRETTLLTLNFNLVFSLFGLLMIISLFIFLYKISARHITCKSCGKDLGRI